MVEQFSQEGDNSSGSFALLERCFNQFTAVRQSPQVSIRNLKSTAESKGIKMMHFCVLRSKLLELYARAKKEGNAPAQFRERLESALGDLLIIVAVHSVVGLVETCVERALALSHGVAHGDDVLQNKHIAFTKEILCDYLNLMMHSNRFWRLDVVNRIDKEFGRGVIDREERLGLKDSIGPRIKEAAELIFVNAGIYLDPGTLRRWRVTTPERSGQFVFEIFDILDTSPILRADVPSPSASASTPADRPSADRPSADAPNNISEAM